MADVKRLQIRRDTLADWVAVNPILLEGEVGLIIENGRISSLKIGDGVSSFAQLPQLTLLEAVFGGYVSRQDLSASLRDYATIQYVDSEIGKILGGASGAYDTLKEIEDILKNDTTGLAALLEEIGTKADTSVVDALASRVSQNESNIADHTNKITANTNNIDNTIRRVAANEVALEKLNQTVDKIYEEYVTSDDIPTKTSQLYDDIGYALARNIKALAGLDIVTKDYIADAAVTTSKIKDGSITRDKLSTAIQQQLGWIPSTTDDLPEGSSKLYFTSDRAVAALNGASLNSLKVGGYGVSENIQALIQSAAAVSGDISKINVRIDGLGGDIERIDGDCDEFNASIGNLESSVRTNTTDIAGLKTRLDNLDLSYADKDEFDDLYDNVGILAGQVSELEEAVGGLNVGDYIKNNGSADSLSITSINTTTIRTQGDYIRQSGSSEVWKLSTYGSGNNPIFSKPLYVQEGTSYNLLATQSWANSNFHPLTTVDTVPTLNSSNLVTSGGVAKAVADLAESADGLYQRKGSYLTSSSTLASANLDKNNITIAGTSIALGGSITQNQLITNLGLKGLAFKDSIDLSGYATQSWVEGKDYLSKYGDAANSLKLGGVNASDYALKADYLPLAGGTITGNLSIDNSSTDIYFRVRQSETNKASFGWESGVGAYLYNYSSYRYLGISDEGTPFFRTSLGINTLIHTGNYSSYALPLSGGTISGDLRLKQYLRINAWEGYGTGSCDAWYNGNNGSLCMTASDIRLGSDYSKTVIHSGNIRDYTLAKDSNGTVSLNGNLDIFNADSSIIIKDGAITSSTYGKTEWSIGDSGNGVFNSLKVGSSSVIHSGNIGSCKAGDTSAFDGKGIGRFIYSELSSTSTGTTDISSASFSYQDLTRTQFFRDNNISSIGLLVYHSLATTYGFALYNKSYTKEALTLRVKNNGEWRNEKTIAFTDSTVAAANKLSTARSIWGQSFDGSGDVSGNLFMTGEVMSLAGDTSGTDTNADSPKLWLGAFRCPSEEGGWHTGSYIQALGGGSYGRHTLSFFTKDSDDYTTAPVERMRITPSGNVLIGTTNSAYKFRVAGNGAFNNEICVYDADDIYRLTCYEYQGIGRIYSYNETDDVFGDLWLGNNNGGVITVKASGNVGIGTTAPQYKLDVIGDFCVNRNNHGSSNTTLRISSSDADVSFYVDDADDAVCNLRFVLEGTERLRLTSEGNVGIGTTNPNTKLHVVGGAKIEGALSTYGITATTTAATDAAFTHYVGSTKLWWVSSYNNCANFSTALYVQSGSTPFKVATENDLTSYLPKAGGEMADGSRISCGKNMYIGRADNLGWVGLQDICSQTSLDDSLWSIRTNGVAHFKNIYEGGTLLSSKYLLQSGGTISGSLTFSSTSGSHILGNSNSEIIFQPSNDTGSANIPLKIAKTGSSTFTMYCDESEVYDLGTSSYKWNILYCRSASQSSDATLKNILGNVELTTAQIANAPAVHFTWKNGGAKDVGTIAQYWKDVLPEVVSGEEGSYGMNYAVLGVVSSIILARNIETHEQRIARLEKEISDLQKELNALVNN